MLRIKTLPKTHNSNIKITIKLSNTEAESGQPGQESAGEASIFDPSQHQQRTPVA